MHSLLLLRPVLVSEEDQGFAPPQVAIYAGAELVFIDQAGSQILVEWMVVHQDDGHPHGRDLAGHLKKLEASYTNFILNCPPNRDGQLDAAIVTIIGQVGSSWTPNASRPPLHGRRHLARDSGHPDLALGAGHAHPQAARQAGGRLTAYQIDRRKAGSFRSVTRFPEK